MTDTASQKITEELNNLFMNNAELRALLPQSARYYYFENKQTKDRFFYTTEKINHNGKMRYVSGTYRYLKSKKAYKLLSPRGFAHKRDAIKKAEKMFDDSNKI